MRWSYILPRLTLLLLVWLFFFFAFDPLLKWGLIKGIEKGAKAKAEIAGLKTSFLHPSLKLTGFAVADANDEFRNLAEFSELSFSAAGAPLLEKKLLVENASLSGLRFGTARKTSGKLPFVKEEPPSEMVQAIKDESKNFALERAADVKADAAADYKVNPDELESVKLAKQLEEDYNKNYKDISDRLDTKKYEAGLEALKGRYEKAKGESNFAKQAKDYADIGKEVKKLTGDFKKDKEEVETALAKAKDAFKAIDEARKKDTAAVMAKMKLPSLDTQSLARMLAGPLIAEKTDQAMKWMAIAKKYMPASSDGVLKNEAPRGRTVHFPKEKTYPTVLVRRLALTGELGQEDPLEYSGVIEGLTTQPQVYGRPTTLAVKGSKGARRLDLTAALDATGDTIKTGSRLSYSGMTVKELKLGSESSFMVEIAGASGAIETDLKTDGDSLDGKASLSLTKAVFKASADKIKAAPLRTAVESSFAGLSSALIEADITGVIKSPKLAVRTDLADKLSKAFSGAMGAEVKKAQAEAQKKIDEALKPYREKLDKLASSKQAELGGKLKDAEGKVTGAGENLLKGLTPSKIKLPKIKF
ncbi:MAG TPA: TIGR03545 family protein [Elusimicrobiales bacterium]|nr:TIGR03545 family protein [Elusimicrobiales bacterium]